MKKIATCIALSLLALLAYAILAGAQAETAATPARQPIPFPTGYDFPANRAKLEAMIKARDIASTRRHGWYLWAGLNQPGYDGWPIWRSWHIATQVFATQPKADAQEKPAAVATDSNSHATAMKSINLKNNPSINLAIPFYLIPDAVRAKHQAALKDIVLSSEIPDGDNFQNNGDLMIVSESYSQPAYEGIRNMKLYEGTTLNALLADKKTDIPALSARTIVLKHMYWPVKKAGLTALPIVNMQAYQQPAVPDTTYVGFENQARWTQAVAIDPTRVKIPPKEAAKVTYLYDVRQPDQTTPLGPNTYPTAKVVPLANFYYKKLTMAEYKAMSVYDQVLIDASFWWVHGRLFEDGDYLASVASHVITRELPSWTMQTLWWYDKPDQGDFAKDRPAIPQAKGPWRHYLMASEYGITTAPGGKSLPIAYNPYIELASHPVVTNCRNCHMRAAWPKAAASYMQSPAPDALADIQPDNPIFKDLLRTDFLWTIPNRAIKP
jgi:hypothetical protein